MRTARVSLALGARELSDEAKRRGRSGAGGTDTRSDAQRRLGAGPLGRVPDFDGGASASLCARGHERTPETTRIINGRVYCLTCQRENGVRGGKRSAAMKRLK